MRTAFILCLVLSLATRSMASDESYLKTMTGKIRKGDTCTVVDDKFASLPLDQWNLIHNISVSNIISFELRQDTSIYFYDKPFTCTLSVTIQYFTSRDMLRPEEMKDVKLIVRYDTATGSFLTVSDKHEFRNGYKVTVTVDSISSPELGKDIPAIFRVKNQIIIKRKYPFSQTVTAGIGLIKQEAGGNSSALMTSRISGSLSSDGNRLYITWDPADFPGAEEYDLEWTFIDKYGSKGGAIISSYGGTTGPYNVPSSLVESWMRNDNSRVTVTGSSYDIHLPYDDGFIMVRVRGVSYQLNTNLRLTTNWQFTDDNYNTACVYIDAHEPDLTWQFTASFAEEGKRKDVISYYDATLRNRQMVTVNKSDEKAIVAETIYDNMGRPAISIIPAPVVDEESRNDPVQDFDDRLKYYRGVNRANATNLPYSYEDISLPNSTCNIGVDKLSAYDAAGHYYSAYNPYANSSNYPNYYFTKYVPDANGYPLAVTEYMADNTGRIRKQGGVGKEFQIGSGLETKYFYGKPLPEEINRLFGMEAGNSSHYLKNMVVDPNGSISVSYVDSRGKTVATALAGKAPGNLDELPSALETAAARHFNDRLIKPEDFSSNPATLQKLGSANFLAAVTGTFQVHYNINPQALVTTHGPGGSLSFCSNCYYDILVEVKNDCSEVVATTNIISAFQPNDPACHSNPQVFTGTLNVPVTKVGEYTVTYLLKLSEDVIKYQTDYYIQNNSDLRTINDFFNDELLLADLRGCYADCVACSEKLGTRQEFTDKMMALLWKLKNEKYQNYPAFDVNSAFISNWIEEVYDELYSNCQVILSACNLSVCDEKLEMMKYDVRPGGQYALYDYDDQTDTYTYVERDISVLQYFNDPNRPNISGITFENENGVTVTIGSLSESDFIEAYISHPEWADEFVKEHVEYCSYLWCIDANNPDPATSNQASYAFDETIKSITKGADAEALGYFNPPSVDDILHYDPFFNGIHGSTYANDMSSDLSDFTNVMGITLIDDNGVPLPGKNIMEFIDWMLYCKPSDPQASGQDFQDSWLNCDPDPGCRSISQEWELYRNYYLVLKSKYVQMAKESMECNNCFIGSDGLGMEDCVRKEGDGPPSSCPEDPRWNEYKDKIRIWDSYVGIQNYMDCMNDNGPPFSSQQDSEDILRDQAMQLLDGMKQNWIDRLKAVRDEEGFNITDNDIENLIVPELELVAKKWIEIAPIENIRPASTLPNGVYSDNGYESFKHVFESLVDPGEYEAGFGPHLLEQPYPHDKTPVTVGPVSSELTYEICQRLSDLETVFQNSLGGSFEEFHAWLKEQLGEDYVLTFDQLRDMRERCEAGCKLTDEILQLPAVFASVPSNPDHPWSDCQRVQILRDEFWNYYPNVPPDGKLYRNLLTTYLNHTLGYSLTYDEYIEFVDVKCLEYSEGLLFNKPASPLLAYDDFTCVANIMAGVFERAAIEYELYIEIERRKFRNAYISKCLSNSAWADLEGDQLEYHYTLYYYDQAGNLVKTVPPEGVWPLTGEQLELVNVFNASDRTTCTGAGVPAFESQAATFSGLSTDLSTNNGKAIECWLYTGTVSTSRQVRAVTPDHLYLVQSAIHNNTLWVQFYNMVPGSGTISITLANQAAADLSSLPPIENWSHLVVQSSTSLMTGTLQLYLDGKKLTNLTTIPAYPFTWTTQPAPGGYNVPTVDVSQLKHLRTYNRVATDAEVWANYKNYCLSPVGALAVSNPLIRWGRFNIPAAGSATTTGPGSTNEWASHFIVPDHGLTTNYYYNSLNQVVKQNSPDGGTSEFLYDRLGRLVISQNQEQKTPKIVDPDNPANRFSYTRYDALGRIIEVGEKLGASALTESQARTQTTLDTWLASGSNRQVTVTAYDEQPSWIPSALTGSQSFLRKRVAATALLSTASPSTDPSQNRVTASYFSYDINGNVHLLVQENTAMAALETGSDGLKRTKYEYDLVSGKVNKVLYQDGKWDQFYYQYLYDAENRLIKALSTRSNPDFPPEQWNVEASYRYYLHGPLARTELGNFKVQGVDYAYTLQGWLKGVNGRVLDPAKDMSQDGKVGDNNYFTHFARDVFAFSLGYHAADYSAIGGSGANAFALQYSHPNFDPTGQVRSFDTGKELFNGNIGHATYAISQLENGNTVGYTYRYDQLNRLTAMRKSNIGSSATSWNNSGILADYAENISYDANGNILTYERNGDQVVSGIPMDDLTYQYERRSTGRLASNRLRYVHDEVQGNAYTGDIKTQTGLSQSQVLQDFSEELSGDNYQYDEIGNLIGDEVEGIDRIQWTVYGKIRSIVKGTTTLTYDYDPGGNRVLKSVDVNGTVTKTFYSRDASGNVLAVYKHTVGGGYSWEEQHLYGSSRLGMLNPGLVYGGTQPHNSTGDPVANGILGKRVYELSNHLGNVLATITDVKTGVDVGSNGSVDYYMATVVSASDYYPFGMMMEGRKYSASGSYRYGFNGKENDNEVKGAGNQIDYGARIYDPRVGRFLSTDPLKYKYPSWTPYAYAMNDVIRCIDLDGEEKKVVIHWIDGFYDDGAPKIRSTSVDINKNISYINVSKATGLPLNDGKRFAGTEIYYAMPDGRFIQQETMYEEITEGGMIPSANYDYTQNVIPGKQADDSRYIHQYDDATMPFSTLVWWIKATSDIVRRDMAAPDNAITMESLGGVTAALTVIGAPMQLRGMQALRVAESNKGWSTFSRNYQKQIAGTEGEAILLNGTRFDGLVNGVLMDAKGRYAFLLEKGWAQEGLLKQAQRQIKAANGASIEWHFAEEAAANTVRQLFKDKGVTGINVHYTPSVGN